jgi:limonene-1,2-epoxide hydrolase
MSESTVATEIEVVRSFFDALEAKDVDRVLELADPAIVYQNVPLPAARGRDAFGRQMRWFERYVTEFEADITHAAADGPIVLTERTDVMRIGRLQADFWVCGTFEVRDGKVVLWRDYFDYAAVAAAFAKGAVRAVIALARSATS